MSNKTDNGAEISKKTNKRFQRYYWAIVFILIFFLSMQYAKHADITVQHYDSKEYWNLANDILYNGYNPIYILRFPQSIRGYFFPVLVGYFKAFFNGIRGWRVLASISVGLCFSLSLPYAIKGRGICSVRELLRTMLAYTVFMWVWGNFMQYPLSDFFSFFFLISAIAILRAIDLISSVVLKAFAGFICGILLYAAYNTRPTFLYSILVILPVYLFINRKNRKYVWIVLVNILLGMVILSLPQCYINNRHEGSFSPKVFYDLVDSEVYRGIYTARYETYTGTLTGFRAAGLVFEDPVGRIILERENISIDDFQINRIFDLFLKYPLDMPGIYFRHLLSLLTPVYRNVYISNIYEIDCVLIIVSIFLWLLAGYGLLVQISNNGLKVDALWIFAVCLPGLLQIFDEPELRFFLPLFVLCYYYVFVMIDYKTLYRAFLVKKISVLIIFLAVFMLWLTLTGSILSSGKDRPLLISDNTAYIINKQK